MQSIGYLRKCLLKIVYTITAAWRENMCGYLSADNMFREANIQCPGTNIRINVLKPKGDYCVYYRSTIFYKAFLFGRVSQAVKHKNNSFRIQK